VSQRSYALLDVQVEPSSRRINDPLAKTSCARRSLLECGNLCGFLPKHLHTEVPECPLWMREQCDLTHWPQRAYLIGDEERDINHGIIDYNQYCYWEGPGEVCQLFEDLAANPPNAAVKKNRVRGWLDDMIEHNSSTLTVTIIAIVERKRWKISLRIVMSLSTTTIPQWHSIRTSPRPSSRRRSWLIDGPSSFTSKRLQTTVAFPDARRSSKSASSTKWSETTFSFSLTLPSTTSMIASAIQMVWFLCLATRSRRGILEGSRRCPAFL
jgi:hypothetical protein